MSLDTLKLNAYRGRNRIVLVFAPSPASDAYLTQKQFLGNVEDGLRERDLLVFYLSGEDANKLKKRFDIPETAFALVLIGKDGGEKKRFTEPTQPAVLFDVIDQMPMRRREMKE